MRRFFQALKLNRKKIFLSLLVILVVIQFFHPARNTGSADGMNDITHYTDVSPEIKQILVTSCYDCHSDHTEYPWYANVQPVAWWLASHVEDGKREVNFSQFNTYRIKRKMRKFHEIAEQIEEGEMPLSSYTLIHRNAVLTSEQSKLLLDWAKKNEQDLIQQYPDSVPKPRKQGE